MSVRAVFVRTVVVLATVLGAYLIYRLASIAVLLFVAVIVASAIRPLVDALGRAGLPRGAAALLIYVVMLGGTIGLLVITVPPIVALSHELLQSGQLVDQLAVLGQALARFGWFELRLPFAIEFMNAQRVSEVMNEAMSEAVVRIRLDNARALREISWRGLLGVGEFLMALVMGYYWLTARERTLVLLLALSPVRSRSKVQATWNDIERTLASWLRGQVILMLVVGITAYVGLTLLNVPFALPLAVIAGLLELVPYLGPVLGATPAIIIAFGESPELGLAVAVLYLAIQQIEGHFLVPRVMERELGLHPLLVLVAIIAGASLNGVVGALLAIPVVGALQVLARHVLIDPALRQRAPRVERGAVLFDREDDDERTGPSAEPRSKGDSKGDGNGDGKGEGKGESKGDT